MEGTTSWSLSNVWEYFVGDAPEVSEEPPTQGLVHHDARQGAALRAALAAPGRMGKASRVLQGILASGLDPLMYISPGELEQLALFGARYAEFVDMLRPDFTTGGWTTSCNEEADVVFAYRIRGDHELQALFIKDLHNFDAVRAAAGFSEVDLHAKHVEGLLESAPLVESADAGLWVQLRETTDEIVQVEMVNSLDEPLGAIVHMYYSRPESSTLFPDVTLPEPRRPRRSLNYKQSVSFTPLPQGHARAHFAFVVDMDPRMQLAILRLPSPQASSLLRHAFSFWPANFQTFLEKHRAEIAEREQTSVHAPFYFLCRELLPGAGPGAGPAPGDSPGTPGAAQSAGPGARPSVDPGANVPGASATAQPDEEEDEAPFFDAEEGEGEGSELHAPPTPLRSGAPAGPSPPGAASWSPDQEALWERFMEGETAPDIPGAVPRRPSSVGTGLNAYQHRHAGDYQALKALEPLDGWDFRMTHDGVDIYTKDVEDLPCKCFKGYVKIKAFGQGRRSLTEALKAHGQRTEWDDLCISSRVVEEYPPFYSVGQFKFASGTRLISAREMLVMCHLYFEDDGSIFCPVTSTEMDSVPPDPDCVRCTLHSGGYIVRPTEDSDVFLLIYTGCVDGGGWVPTWVQDLVAWRQPLALGKFKAYFEESAQEGGVRFDAVRGVHPSG